MSRLENAVEVDLHGHRFVDATMRIYDEIEEAWYNGREHLLFIHGYKNGVAIRNFIRSSGGLRKKVSKIFSDTPELEIVPHGQGSTYVILKGKRKVVRRAMDNKFKNVSSSREEREVIYDNHIIVRGEIPEFGIISQDSGSSFVFIGNR